MVQQIIFISLAKCLSTSAKPFFPFQYMYTFPRISAIFLLMLRSVIPSLAIFLFLFSTRHRLPAIFRMTLHIVANYAIAITSDNAYCSMCRKRVTANLVQVSETFKETTTRGFASKMNFLIGHEVYGNLLPRYLKLGTSWNCSRVA